MSYLGDRALASTVTFNFTTTINGQPTDLAGSPAISVYKTGSNVETTTGATLTAPYDSRTGLAHVVIDTSTDGTFYATGNDFSVVITTGTLGGISQIGQVVGEFSIGLTTANTTTPPTAAVIASAVWQDTTAGDFTTALSVGKSVMNGVALGTGLKIAEAVLVDTLTTYSGNTPQTGDAFAIVKSGGTGDNAAIKTKTDNLPAAPASTTNITAGTITTTTNLTNAPTVGDFTTAMKTSLNAATPASVVGAVGSVAGNVSGSVGSVVGLTASNLDTTISSRATAAQATSIQADIDDIQTRLPAALVGGRMDASVGAMVANTLTASALATDAVNEIADGMLDRADAVEVGLTPRQAYRVALAAVGGKVSGAATTTNTFRNAVADSKNRIVATVDVDGNRTAITYDLTS